MTNVDLVRPSRDGDQFHYHWAARHCLALLSLADDLVAVTIEGASTIEDSDVPLREGEELIDVGFYYGSEELAHARRIRYVQLKHSTRRAHQHWTASGLEKTIQGFAARYNEVLGRLAKDEIRERIRYEFTTNRPIEESLQKALEDLGREGVPADSKMETVLLGFTQLDETKARDFFKLFSTVSGEPDLWSDTNASDQSGLPTVGLLHVLALGGQPDGDRTAGGPIFTGQGSRPEREGPISPFAAVLDQAVLHGTG